MQYQILQIETMSVLWQTVGRIINEILGVKGWSSSPGLTFEFSLFNDDNHCSDWL